MRLRFVVCCLLLVAGSSGAFDDECVELGLREPGATDPNLAFEVELLGSGGFVLERAGLLEGITAGETVELRIGHEASPARQVVADVVLSGSGGATLSRPGTELACRRMRWVVTLLDGDGREALVRDRFEVRLGPVAQLAFLAPDETGRPTRPRWRLGDRLEVRVGVEEPYYASYQTRWARKSELLLHPAAGPPVGLVPAPPFVDRPFDVDRRALAAGTAVRLHAALMAVDQHGNETVAGGVPVGLAETGLVQLAMRRFDTFLAPPRFDLIVTGAPPPTATFNLPTSTVAASPTSLTVSVVDRDGPRVAAEPVQGMPPTQAVLELTAAGDGGEPVSVEIRVEGTAGSVIDDIEIQRFGALPEGRRRAASRLTLDLTPGEPQRVEVAAAEFRLGALWWSVRPLSDRVTVNGWCDPVLARRLLGHTAGVATLGAGVTTLSHSRGLLLFQRQSWNVDQQRAELRDESEGGQLEVIPVVVRRSPGGADWAADLLYVIDGAPVDRSRLDGAVVVPVFLGVGSLSVSLPAASDD